ncbi:clostripain-related cysteine peptidase [Legionella fairfieldensis]|uniref:clostripain-related cysteine peptidase n=1 Tax=Legionella fairfieldensis TaxID=45064 RepID=UPI00048F1846|nr:clostripain-related cysteine peptidase [Legionella fairfieldensis]
MCHYLRHYFYLLTVICFWSNSINAGVLPLTFISAPAAHDMAIGQVQTLHYTIHNNVQTQSLPLKSISIINNDGNQANTALITSTTCGTYIAPNANCSITVTLNNPVQAGLLNRYLSINYGGRAPLISPIILNVTQAKYTVLVYIVGADLERNDHTATANINQMMQVGSSKNMNIVIETGGSLKPGWQTVQRKLVLPGSLALIKDLGRINMGATSTIQDFLVWGVRTFPADRYIVVYWDHGGGPNGGFGGDELFPQSIRSTPINQLAAATMGAYNNTGKRFEIIGFDACLLGNIETLAGLYPYTNYYVASEDLEPGKSWQYNTFLNYINTHPMADGLRIGIEIVNGYTNQNKGDSTTLSVIDSSAIPSLLTAITNFATALQPYTTTITDWKNLARGRLKAPDYATSVWDNDSFDLVDLIGFAKAITEQFPADATLQFTSNYLISSTQYAVKYYQNSANRQDSFGLQIYFPSLLAFYDSDYPNTTVLNGTQFFSQNYMNLVSTYHDFYNTNKASLIATLSNVAFDGNNYTSTVSNDYDQLYAAVGNDGCTNVYNDTRVNLGSVPCYVSLQYSGIESTTGGGNTWDISFSKNQYETSWPLLNDKPVLFIPDDNNPSLPGEDTFLIPATKISTATNGYLQVINQNNQYQVVGFQEKAGGSNTIGKVDDIDDNEEFYLRTYALNNGSWLLLQTDVVVKAPLCLTFGAVSPTFNAFRFLVGDLTGALNITANSAAY